MESLQEFESSEFEPQDFETDLNALIHNYGLTAVLESLRDLTKSRAEAIASSGDYSDDVTKAFQQVTHALSELIEVLPPELDVGLALEQLTHSSPDLDSSDEKLPGGLE
jgi:hypothetical protein